MEVVHQLRLVPEMQDEEDMTLVDPSLRSSRRSGMSICLDVIRACTKPIKPTVLMYQSNLSYVTLKKFVLQLEEMGLIKKLAVSAPRIHHGSDRRTTHAYQATDKGLEMLRTLDRLGIEKLNF